MGGGQEAGVLWVRVQGDDGNAADERAQSRPFGDRQDAREEEPGEERREEDLGLLHDGEGARVDTLEAVAPLQLSSET